MSATMEIAHAALRWAAWRLAIYSLAAVGGMAVFVAGVAFYTFVWPGAH